MKKLLFIGGAVLLLFIVLVVLQNISQNKQLADNKLYDKDDLHPETVKQLSDKNYQNVIMPDALEKKLSTESDVVVYFFSPTCPACQQSTAPLMEAAELEGVHIDQYNLLEYEKGWEDYHIEATPTIVYFKDGEEVDRLKGVGDVTAFQTFLKQTK
ncbi:thioredoxin family protein [Bacillus sp. FSL W7-1360]